MHFYQEQEVQAFFLRGRGEKKCTWRESFLLIELGLQLGHFACQPVHLFERLIGVLPLLTELEFQFSSCECDTRIPYLATRDFKNSR